MAKDINTLVSQSIIANQLALNLNEEIKHTDCYKMALKGKLNALIPELVKAEKKEFDKIFNIAEKETVQIYDVLELLVAELADLGMHHFEAITAILKAYKVSPASINGIVNKISNSQTAQKNLIHD
jgi:predicted nucleic acid-binding OB-fold protein